MKKYINYSNKKIVLYAYLSVLTFIVSMYGFNKDIGYLFGYILILILPILIIISNTKEIYTTDDDKIARKALGLKIIHWVNIREVLISDWYITITSNTGINFKILKKKDCHDLFETIKQDIICHVGNDVIEYHEPVNEESMKREGGLRALYANFVVQSFMPVGAYFQIVELLKSTTLINTLYQSVYLAQILVISILAIYIWILFRRNNFKTVKFIRIYALSQIAFVVIIRSINIIGQLDILSLSIIISSVSSLGYSILMSLIILEYVNTSERVKHYFVK